MYLNNKYKYSHPILYSNPKTIVYIMPQNTKTLILE